MTEQPLFQVIDHEGRIVGNYLRHTAAIALIEHFQIHEGRIGNEFAVKLRAMPAEK
ncbi:hypothetical protein [Caballeronia sordidicola]|uniref:hypothetical protein n=1 Tax=Caballeronia sordidicola TaxID=196367 RepID=UPI0015C51D1B|nr:hypothetical protein [Caballeronia sordidicola]